MEDFSRMVINDLKNSYGFSIRLNSDGTLPEGTFEEIVYNKASITLSVRGLCTIIAQNVVNSQFDQSVANDALSFLEKSDK